MEIIFRPFWPKRPQSRRYRSGGSCCMKRLGQPLVSHGHDSSKGLRLSSAIEEMPQGAGNVLTSDLGSPSPGAPAEKGST
jgi:hypothetical protein